LVGARPGKPHAQRQPVQADTEQFSHNLAKCSIKDSVLANTAFLRDRAQRAVLFEFAKQLELNENSVAKTQP
jgi:hypothetical protein